MKRSYNQNRDDCADEKEHIFEEKRSDVYDLEAWQEELQNMFKDQPVSFDPPETVIFPKVNEFRHNLGLLGHVTLYDFSETQMGRKTVEPSHHVTQHELSQLYNVTVCASCSGIDTPYYLGTFVSLEDAMLVDEIHSLIFERFAFL